jgi:hypothetical protein
MKTKQDLINARATPYRFLTCAGVVGPVSETIGEFGGVKDFKPWVLVTAVHPSNVKAGWTDVTLFVVPTGSDNSPQGEENPNTFEVTDVPIDWLPSGAGLHDAFVLSETGYRYLATFRK